MGASETWDKSVLEIGAIRSAAAAAGVDPFAKFPEWIWEHIPQRGTVLDVGCGYGRIVIPILKVRPELRAKAVDASAAMLKHLGELAQQSSISDRLDVTHATFPPLPADANSIDLTITSAVLLHNPYEVTRSIVKDIYRVLKPGGKVVFIGSFPARWNAEGIQNFVAQTLVRSMRTRNGPVRTYTRHKVLQTLAPFKNHGHVELFAHQATVFPRAVLGKQLPCGAAIRKLNRFAERSPRMLRLFARGYEVVAVKY